MRQARSLSGLHMFFATVLAAAVSLPAVARDDRRVTFDIHRQSLDAAIRQLAMQSGRQMLFQPSPALRRPFGPWRAVTTVDRALHRLLDDAGMTFRENERRVILIGPAPPPPVAKPTSPPEDSAAAEMVVTAAPPGDLLEFTGDRLWQPRTFDVADVVQNSLGMSIQPNGSGQQGIMQRGTGIAGDATTIIYFADVPIVGPAGTTNSSARTLSDIALIDIERVETTRSPQGTEHGVGSLAGEIRVAPSAPRIGVYEGTTSLGATVLTGGEWGYEADAVLNLPVADNAAVRATGYARKVGGYIDDVRIGRNDVNSEAMQGARLSFLYEPSPALNISGLMLWQHRRIADASAWTRGLGAYRSDRYFSAPTTHRFLLAQLNVDWRLGRHRLTSTSALYDWTLDRTYDRTITTQAQAIDPAACQRYQMLDAGTACNALELDGFQAFAGQFTPTLLHIPITVQQATQEVRLTDVPISGLGYVVGLFGAYRRESLRSELSSLPDSTDQRGTYFGARAIAREWKQLATFGTITYRSERGPVIEFGWRYDHYDVAARNEVIIPNVISGSMTSYPFTRNSTSGLHTKLHFDIPLTPRATLHAQIARALRPGGVNSASIVPDNHLTFDADTLWSYEMGAKIGFGRSLDMRFTAYVNAWRDMQYRALTENRSNAYIVNIGDASIKGLEVELTGHPLPKLRTSIEVSLISAKLVGASPARSLVGQAMRNDPIPFVPRQRLLATASYNFGLSQHAQGRLDLEWQYRSGIWSTFNVDDPDYVSTAGYALLSAGAAIDWDASTVSLSVKNLLNSHATLNAATNGYGIGQSYSYGPRNIALRWTRRW